MDRYPGGSGNSHENFRQFDCWFWRSAGIVDNPPGERNRKTSAARVSVMAD
jgi:hypothetical protein